MVWSIWSRLYKNQLEYIRRFIAVYFNKLACFEINVFFYTTEFGKQPVLNPYVFTHFCYDFPSVEATPCHRKSARVNQNISGYKSRIVFKRSNLRAARSISTSSNSSACTPCRRRVWFSPELNKALLTRCFWRLSKAFIKNKYNKMANRMMKKIILFSSVLFIS